MEFLCFDAAAAAAATTTTTTTNYFCTYCYIFANTRFEFSTHTDSDKSALRSEVNNVRNLSQQVANAR